MNNYVIFTDSACDIKPELLKRWGVECIDLSFRFDGDDREYFNSDMDIREFYRAMREGSVAKTSAINPDRFLSTFEAVMKQDKDILYLGFSSGLSTTCNSARMAAEELKERYPARKLLIVDTLAASAGQGLLLYLVLQKKNEGATIDDAYAYAREMKLQICHWFTVDDLVYLKRGGRVSPTVALLGKALGIKPVLHVDNAGKLISMGKVRGRKASIAALAEKCTGMIQDPKDASIFISHGDCPEDADLLAQMVEEKTGAKVSLITHVGTVIGAHSGPGTLALFFVGKER
ncbi:MAG: DegV family protein [Ruminococcaceae bacterium]|nr:DegV family protein [Oscillospiraceae bacterium]